MYTINGIKNLGRSGVRWNPPAAPGTVPAAAPENSLNKAKDLLKKIRESNFSKSSELAEFRELLKKEGKYNEDKSKALKNLLENEIKKTDRPTTLDYTKYNREQYYDLPTPGDKDDIRKLLKDWEIDSQDVEAKIDAAKDSVKTTSAKGQLEVRSAVVTQQEQTEALKKIIANDSSVGVKAFLEVITEREDGKGNVDRKVTDVQLSDTTVGSVILTLLGLNKAKTNKKDTTPITEDEFKKSYTSNGAYWFGDKQAVQKLLDIFNNSKYNADIVKVFEKLAPVYQALGTTVQYEKNQTAVKDINEDNILTKLSDLPRFAGDKAMQAELQKMLKSIPKGKEVDHIKGIIAIGGGTLNVSNMAGVIGALRADPSLLSRYHAGMNLLGNSGPKTLGNYIRTGKFELAPDMKSLEADMKKLVEDARGKGAKTISESPMTDAEKKTALAELDKRYEALNTPESIRTFAYHASALVTNDGVGLAGGITTEAKSLISDSITAGLFAGIANGGAEIGASLMAKKNLHTSQNATFDVFYGITASKTPGVVPTIGAGGSYKDLIYSVYTNKLGAGFSLGMKTGENQQAAEIMKNIAATPEAVRKMLDEGIKNKANFKIDTGNPANNEWINTRTQQLLTAGGYDSMTDANQKEIALHTALVDAVREKAYMVKEMIKDNEWGLTAIGVNFGKFAGLTYILPGFSWSKTETFHMTKVSGGEATAEKKESKIYTLTRDASDPAKATLSDVLPADTTVPQGVIISDDKKTITGLDPKKNIKLETKVGKVTVSYDGEVKDVSTNADVAPKQSVEMKEVIADSKTRQALSYFAALVKNNTVVGGNIQWIDKNVNIASTNLERDKDLILKDLKNTLVGLLSRTTGKANHDASLKDLVKGIKKMTDPKDVLNEARKIRDALMTDIKQSANISTPRDAKKGEKTNQAYLDEMKKDPKFKQALGDGGMVPEDFNSLTPQNPNQIGYTPKLYQKMIGAVATWKFPPAHMAYLPSGAVWMSSEPQVTTKKSEVLATLEKSSGSILGAELQKVKDVLKTPFGKEPTDEEIKDLLLGKEVKNGTKTLKLDAKFYTFCYGACMNPSVGLEIGKYTITEPGKPTANGSATIEAATPGMSGTNMSFGSTDSVSSFSLGIGATRTDTESLQTATTNPSDRVAAKGPAGTPTAIATGGSRPITIPTPAPTHQAATGVLNTDSTPGLGQAAIITK